MYILLLRFGIIDSIYGIAIAWVKRHDDVLEGINKLDHLLVVSIFQVYKNKERQR